VGLRKTADLPWLNRLDLDRYWRFVLPAVGACAVVSATVVVATFLGDADVSPSLGIVLLPVVFAGAFGTVASEQQLNRGNRELGGWPSALFRALPRWQRYALVAVIATGLVIIATSFVRLRGDPVQLGEGYYLDDRGDLTAITHDEYIEHRKYHLRVFVGGPGVFALTALGTGLGHRRRRALDPPPDPWPGPQYQAGPSTGTSAWPPGSWPPARWSPNPPRPPWPPQPGPPWPPN
jgi:hypothetical protein